MPVNEELSEIVLEQMFQHLSKVNLSLSEEDKNFAKDLICKMGSARVDEPAKFRIMFGPMLGYGYDFRGEIDGKSARGMYENGVRATKEHSGKPHFETFIDSGVVEEKYGWYLTTI